MEGNVVLSGQARRDSLRLAGAVTAGPYSKYLQGVNKLLLLINWIRTEWKLLLRVMSRVTDK